MEFIKFDEKQEASYFGECNIIINTFSKQIIVEPTNKGTQQFMVPYYNTIFRT